MNIFSLDTCAIKSAQFLCDKHMKMLLESAQLLCTTFWMQDIEAPYRKTHYNHPSAIWARESKGNFNWLLNHAIAIAKEYTFRYDKRHKSENVIDWVAKNQDKLNFDKNEQTEFAIAISPEQKCRKHPDFDSLSPVEKYRLYYIYDKAGFCTWKKRSAPEWFCLDLVKNQSMIAS